MDSNNAIELRNVSLSYLIETNSPDRKGLLKKSKTKIENRVLDGINLDIKKGEILGIVGVNGAGKSTLLSIIARILEPNSGTVETNGKVATILELGMGFHQDLSGRENIILKGELYGFSKKLMESKMEEIIEYSGIRKYIDNPVRTYSSGMRSRLAFSIMIHVNAEIMLVDEILSTGDTAFSAKASDFFKKILKDGKTVVYVSHSPGSIEAMCTRAIWLDKGKIIADGKPKKICAQYHESSMESLDVVVDQAKSGLSDAQYRLAMFYKEGINVEQNEEIYQNWLELAAEQGHIKAQVELADILMKSGLQEDIDAAISLYQSSATRGDPIARSRISAILGKEELGKERSVLNHIFRCMAETGNPSDMFRYANFLLKTALDKTEREESFKWFKRTAEEFNHPDAIIQTAVMYRDGIGTKKNKEKYLEILERGNSLGIVKATSMLADLYVAGVIVEEDLKKALDLYEKCAEKGHVPCQYTTAMMYQEGKGTEKNIEKARYWFDIYSKSQLVPYQLSAIGILKDRCVYGAPDIHSLYSLLESSKDPKALMELCTHIHECPEKYGERGIKLLSESYNKLSESYGKGMSTAFQYYSRLDSMGYDASKSRSIMEKSVYAGDSLIQGALETIRLIRLNDVKLLFFTNNSEKTRKEIANKLNRLGVTCTENDIVSSGFIAVNLVKERGFSNIFICGSESFKKEFDQAGIDLTNEFNCKTLIIGMDSKFDYQKLTSAVNAAIRADKIIACNLERIFPVEDGSVRPGCGAMVSSIEYCSRKKVDIIVGKPETYMLHYACRLKNTTPDRAIIIGDTFDSDIKMAIDSGSHNILIGKHDDAEYTVSKIGDVVDILIADFGFKQTTNTK